MGPLRVSNGWYQNVYRAHALWGYLGWRSLFPCWLWAGVVLSIFRLLHSLVLFLQLRSQQPWARVCPMLPKSLWFPFLPHCCPLLLYNISLTPVKGNSPLLRNGVIRLGTFANGESACPNCCWSVPWLQIQCFVNFKVNFHSRGKIYFILNLF